MSDDLAKQSIKELQDIVHCDCGPAYLDRGLHSHVCLHYMADALKIVADRIEELEAKLAKAEELQEAQKLFNLYAVQILMLGATVSRLQNLENAWVNLKTQAELTGGQDE